MKKKCEALAAKLNAEAQAIRQGSTVSLVSRRYGSQYGINTLTALNNCVTPLSND